MLKNKKMLLRVWQRKTFWNAFFRESHWQVLSDFIRQWGWWTMRTMRTKKRQCDCSLSMPRSVRHWEGCFQWKPSYINRNKHIIISFMSLKNMVFGPPQKSSCFKENTRKFALFKKTHVFWKCIFICIKKTTPTPDLSLTWQVWTSLEFVRTSKGLHSKSVNRPFSTQSMAKKSRTHFHSGLMLLIMSCMTNCLKNKVEIKGST